MGTQSEVSARAKHQKWTKRKNMQKWNEKSANIRTY